MLKPPISRMGGKSKLRKTIIEMIPEHSCYIELFFGAGWVYFGKEPSKVEVINDIDKELINLFKMIKYLSLIHILKRKHLIIILKVIK